MGVVLLLSCLVELAILSHDLSPRHLLLRTVLSLADSDESDETVDVPLLTFERNVEGHHPTVDHLGGDGLSGVTGRVRVLTEGRGGLTRSDVLVDFSKEMSRDV